MLWNAIAKGVTFGRVTANAHRHVAVTQVRLHPAYETESENQLERVQQELRPQAEEDSVFCRRRSW